LRGSGLAAASAVLTAQASAAIVEAETVESFDTGVSGVPHSFHQNDGLKLYIDAVEVGLLDGSVKFIKGSISRTTWGAIATKAGGEIVSADQF
jgi:hypothetical protein